MELRSSLTTRFRANGVDAPLLKTYGLSAKNAIMGRKISFLVFNHQL